MEFYGEVHKATYDKVAGYLQTIFGEMVGAHTELPSFRFYVGRVGPDEGELVLVRHDLLPSLDFVLVMSVNPGFAGQAFLPYCLEKARRLSSTVSAKPTAAATA